MRTVDSILTNFTAGELSPNMYGRTDIEKYYNGCMTMENFLVLPQGGAYRRPGSRYVASVKTASAFTRLVPFVFSTTQAYMLEFGNLYMRVYYDGGQVLHTTSTTSAWATETGYVVADFVKNDDVIYRCISAHTSGATTEPGTGESWEDKWVADTTYEIATPYTTAQLPDLKFAQSADTLYIVHPSHEPRQLTRTAHTTWTLTALAWENGPFMKDNDDDSHTLTVTSYGGSDGADGDDWDIIFGTGGNTWYSGSSDPSDELGVDGDFYLNTTSWDVFMKISGEWSFLGNILYPGQGASGGGSRGLYGQTVTVTSSADLFTSTDVGRWLKIGYYDEGEQIDVDSYNPSGAGDIPGGGPWNVDGKFEVLYSFGDYIDRYVELRYSTNGGSTYKVLDTYPDHTSTTRIRKEYELRSEDYNHVTPKIKFWVSGDSHEFRWAVRKLREARTAYLKITTYSTAKLVRAKVYRRMSQFNVPTNNWALGAWGTTPGWPSSVTFHQGRLVFAGTTSEPSKVWMSVSDDYPNFDPGEGDEDADAISLTPIASEVNNVIWMASKGNLLIGTAGDEWVFDGANITPTNPPHARRETNFGSAKWQAVIANGYVVFVQDGEKIVRQMQYDYDSDTYLAIDLTAMSDHITGDGISYLAYLKSPWSTIWTCRDDGELIGLTYVPEHKVFAWHRHDLGGDVESVACIPGEIWVVVKRTINSATVRYIERILPWDGTLNNSVFMDCAAEYSGTATTTITGLSHLEGETVGIISNGKYVGTKVVDSGAITLDATTTHAWVGLPYTSTLKTINIEHANPPGTSQGAKRRIVHAIARLVNTVGGKVGFDASDADDIEYDDEGNPNVSTPELFTGDTNPVLITTSSGRPQYLTLVQDEPYPFSVSAVVLRMEVQN